MEKVHILVTAPFINEAHIAKIKSVDPRLEIKNANEEIRIELGIPRAMIPAGNRQEKPELTPEEAKKVLDRELADTDIMFGWRLPVNLLTRAPRLKWVQGTAAGFDTLAGDSGVRSSDIIVTNAHENSTAVAEYAIYLLLMLAKKAPVLFTNRNLNQWVRFAPSEVTGKTLGIIGMGAIGSKVAHRAHAFGMRILATRRTALNRENGTDTVDKQFPPEDLCKMLPECDYVVVAVPSTPETRGMIGENELRVMKPTSYIINVARGPIIDQDKLIEALREGWIAGAGLDVFDTEPLPLDNALWKLSNVIISPHVAFVSQGEVDAVIELFCNNLKRYLNNEPLLNVVDKARGY